MSDEQLRKLERRWKETGAIQDEAAYLLERVRTGELTLEQLNVAAFCGHAGALRTAGFSGTEEVRLTGLAPGVLAASLLEVIGAGLGSRFPGLYAPLVRVIRSVGRGEESLDQQQLSRMNVQFAEEFGKGPGIGHLRLYAAGWATEVLTGEIDPVHSHDRAGAARLLLEFAQETAGQEPLQLTISGVVSRCLGLGPDVRMPAPSLDPTCPLEIGS